MKGKSEQTKEKILKAATELFLENGYEELTLEKIAAKAGISKGGLLYHYSSKDELIESIFKNNTAEELEYIKESIEEIERSDIKEKKKKIISLIKEFTNENFDEYNKGVLIAFTKNPKMVEISRDVDKAIYEMIMKYFRDKEFVLILKLALDGYFYSKMFGMDFFSEEQKNNIWNMINKLMIERINIGEEDA